MLSVKILQSKGLNLKKFIFTKLQNEKNSPKRSNLQRNPKQQLKNNKKITKLDLQF